MSADRAVFMATMTIYRSGDNSELFIGEPVRVGYERLSITTLVRWAEPMFSHVGHRY